MDSTFIPFTAETLHEVCAAAAAEERERLSGLLHDGVLQSLNVAALELAHLKLELMAAADLGVTFPALPFAKMLQSSDALERQMRRAFGDVRGWLRRENDAPSASFAAGRQPDGSLAGALRWLVLRRLRFGLEELPEAAPTPLDDPGHDWHGMTPHPGSFPTVQIRVDGSAVALSPAVEAEVLAIVQEALLNAHRHGHARSIRVAADFHTAGALRVIVLDDGRPAPPAMVPTRAPDGFGLRTMRGRAARLGATLEIAPVAEAGEGTCVCLELFLKPSPVLI